MGANLRILVAFLLNVLAQPGFWYGMTAVGCAYLIGERVLSAARHLSVDAAVMTGATRRDTARILQRLDAWGARNNPPDASHRGRTSPIHEALKALDDSPL